MKIEVGSRRSGKSLIVAELVANQLRSGRRVYLAHNGVCERIVSVPGFADGQQLPAPRCTSCDGIYSGLPGGACESCMNTGVDQTPLLEKSDEA